MFGMKEIAKFAIIALLSFLLFAHINLVSAAMEFWGYIALIFTTASFYLQETLNTKKLLEDLKEAYNFGRSAMHTTISGVEEETAQIKQTVKNWTGL